MIRKGLQVKRRQTQNLFAQQLSVNEHESFSSLKLLIRFSKLITKPNHFMNSNNKFAISLLAFVFFSQNIFAEANSPVEVMPADPFLWLEDVTGEKALNWVKQQNKVSETQLKTSPIYHQVKSDALTIMNSEDKIRYATIRGDKVYNFWRDAKNPRGVYREATLKDYLAGNPNWESVLDIDELNEKENENWVYKGFNCLFPDYQQCLVSLSRGGADATVVREFDMSNRAFVTDGFFIPEAKTNASWRDKDTLYVGTDFGEGSLTSSGYPRISKLWSRGKDLASAKVVYKGSKDSVSAAAYRSFSIHGNKDLIWDSTSFYTNDVYVANGNEYVKILKPENADVTGIFMKNIFVTLKSDWEYAGKTFSQGSVIYSSQEAIFQGKPDYQIFVEPTNNKIINGIQFSQNYVWVNWLENVRSNIERFYKSADGVWESQRMPFDSTGTVDAFGMQEDSDSFFVNYESFLSPTTLYYMDGKTFEKTQLQSLSGWFDAENFKVEQHFVNSIDGTKVPYFLVMGKDTKLNSKNPTLLYGYGGFEISMLPYYSGLLGKAWLENGGVYALANIRGGGEYGPAWHQAALKEHRQRAYEDFEAVANDLISKKITSPRHLGVQGGSNGGLLVGNMITRSPELFNAIVCQVPLLDMKRYNKLLAGASWMAEYGNPDIEEEWQFIKEFSPYHNLDPKKDYPIVLFTTSTRDDRVHPGHARKMVAKMQSMSKDVLYYENIEGGHGGAADNNQRAHLYGLVYAYLFEQLN